MSKSRIRKRRLYWESLVDRQLMAADLGMNLHDDGQMEIFGNDAAHGQDVGNQDRDARDESARSSSGREFEDVEACGAADWIFTEIGCGIDVLEIGSRRAK